MQDFETVRLNLMINGYFHLLAINIGMVGSLSLLLHTLLNKGLTITYYSVIGTLSFLLVIMTGNRSDIMIPIIFLLASLTLFGKLKLNLKQLILFLFLLIVLALVKHLRDFGQGGDDYLLMVSGQLIGEITDLSLYLYPLYMTLTYNFVIFDRVIQALAENPQSHTNGFYTAYAIISVLPIEKISFGQYKNELLNLDFYSGLTTTFISNFYVDFGAIGVVIGSLILGVIATLAYRATSRVTGKFIYGVIVARFSLLFYVFPFEQFYSLWQIAFVCMFSFMIYKRGYQFEK